MLTTLFLSCALSFGGDMTPVRPAADVGTGPKPAIAPISWEFDLKFLPPRRIDVLVPGSSKPETYWYLIYTVTNTSGTTQRFFPQFQLVTEDLKVVDTDTGISPNVFDAIKERHKVTHRYLVHPTQAIGDLAVGDDNARESVAIWRGVDADVNNFSIYCAGLSGEAQTVRNPVYDAKQPETRKAPTLDGREREVVVNPRYFVLRKTLELKFEWPGSQEARASGVPTLVKQSWIMR